MPRICTVFIFLSLFPVISFAANVKKYFINMPTPIVVRKGFAETNAAVQDLVARKINKEKAIDLIVGDPNFEVREFRAPDYILINMDEDVLLLNVGSQTRHFSGRFRPAVISATDRREKFFGLVDVEDIRTFAECIDYHETRTQEIVEHPIPENITVIYAICPPSRNGLCRIGVRRNGRWERSLVDGPLMEATAQSHLGLDQGRSIRLTPSTDTPQGIYFVSAVMYPSESPIFGNLPRIDIDGSSSTCEFVALPCGSVVENLVPPSACHEYSLNECRLAYSIGRYAIRLHGEPTPEHVANTSRGERYYCDQGTKRYYRTAGCINLGNQNILELVTIMDRLRLINHEERCFDNTNNTEIKKVYDGVFLIVLDDNSNCYCH